MPDEINDTAGDTTDETTDTGDGAGGDNNGDDGAPDIAALRKEAAGHRRKAREAEAERDRLAGLVAAMQRNEVERRAEQRMHRGDDLWTAGVQLDELLDDDGALDLAKVDAKVAELLKQRPHWSRRPVGSADQGARGAAPSSMGWAEAIRGRA